MDEAEARRRARASWETAIFRDAPEAEAQADARFWARLSPTERILTAWALSQEMYALAHPDAVSMALQLRRTLVRVIRA
jgi:hypothetical protein